VKNKIILLIKPKLNKLLQIFKNKALKIKLQELNLKILRDNYIIKEKNFADQFVVCLSGI